MLQVDAALDIKEEPGAILSASAGVSLARERAQMRHVVVLLVQVSSEVWSWVRHTNSHARLAEVILKMLQTHTSYLFKEGCVSP
jgi:hypothetical protein